MLIFSYVFYFIKSVIPSTRDRILIDVSKHFTHGLFHVNIL